VLGFLCVQLLLLVTGASIQKVNFVDSAVVLFLTQYTKTNFQSLGTPTGLDSPQLVNVNLEGICEARSAL
jgi:hypothetical protein